MFRKRILIEGKVQGVFFRAYTRKIAKDLSLKGWVRNLHDGRVEALFEGDYDAVEKAVELCRQGPPTAKVTKAEIFDEESLEDLHSFEIRY